MEAKRMEESKWLVPVGTASAVKATTEFNRGFEVRRVRLTSAVGEEGGSAEAQGEEK